MNNTDIAIHKPYIGEEELKAVHEVLESGMISSCQKTEELEQIMMDMYGYNNAIAVNSCSNGLYLSLKLGLQNKGNVIIPAYSFISLINAVNLAGKYPTVVDVDKHFNMDIEEANKKITKSTVAVAPVHIHGIPFDVTKLKYYDNRKYLIVEDCARAIGLKDICKGDIAVFSFNFKKTVVCGQGGLILINDNNGNLKHSKIPEIIRRYIDYGRDEDGDYHVGLNFKLPDILSTIALVQLKRMEALIKMRSVIVGQYRIQLNESIQLYKTSNIKHWCNTNYDTFMIVKDHKLKAKPELGIIKGIANKPLGTENKYPNAWRLYRNSLSLPVYPQLTHDEIIRICQYVNEA